MTRLIAILLALSLVVSCATAMPTAYYLPLAGNDDPDAADHCAYRCEKRYEKNRNYDKYASCLAKCPGVQARKGEQCGKTDVPPTAVCAVVLERRVTAGAIVGGFAFVLILGGTLFLLVLAGAGPVGQT